MAGGAQGIDGGEEGRDWALAVGDDHERAGDQRRGGVPQLGSSSGGEGALVMERASLGASGWWWWGGKRKNKRNLALYHVGNPNPNLG
jgi:hypothetical protein